jgi:hypothetical protein
VTSAGAGHFRVFRSHLHINWKTGLETWHGRDAVTLADERARQQGTQTSTYTGAPVLDPTDFREMKAFVEFCDDMGADLAIFERLQNRVFPDEEFRQKAVHHPDHSLYPEFVEVIKDPVFRSERVWHDFDYEKMG